MYLFYAGSRRPDQDVSVFTWGSAYHYKGIGSVQYPQKNAVHVSRRGAMIPLPASKPNAPDGVCFMFSFLIVLAFVAVIIGPAILASIQNALSRERDL